MIKEFKRVIADCKASIGYHPLPDEESYSKVKLLSPVLKKHKLLPSDKKSDPIKWALRCAESYKNAKVCVIVPGQRFDIYGSRHGRGGGWYDKFLAHIPPSWVRVGITDTKRLYLSPIPTHTWDEPVDWIMYRSGKKWRVYKTNARKD